MNLITFINVIKKRKNKCLTFESYREISSSVTLIFFYQVTVFAQEGNSSNIVIF